MPAPPVPAAAEALLVDGSVGVVRPVVASDAAALHRLHRELSEDSLRLRFFSAARGAAEQYVEHLLRDGPLTLVLEQDGRVLALATAEPVSAHTAEVSFLVEDGRHGLGIGTLLLEHLAAAARTRGVQSFEAQVLVENHAMLRVLVDAGFTLTRSATDGVTDVVLDLAPTRHSAAAADARARRAEATSLDPLLHPHSVALVGVRADGTGVGRALLDHVVAGGFRGELFVVHPRLTDTPGARVVRRFADLPHPVDLAVVAVADRHVLEVVADAAAVGVPAVVVVGPDTPEDGPGRGRLDHELGLLARSSGTRVVGPGSAGVVANDPEVSLDAMCVGCAPGPGGLAVAVQAPAAAAGFTGLAREVGLGVGAVVALGDRVDVSAHDLLAAWTDDPRVTAAALLVESVASDATSVRLVRTFCERKPLLVVAGGHVSGATLPGAIRCDGVADLVEVALLLTRPDWPALAPARLAGYADWLAGRTTCPPGEDEDAEDEATEDVVLRQLRPVC